MSIPTEQIPEGTGSEEDFRVTFSDVAPNAPIELDADPNAPPWNVPTALGLWILSLLLVSILPAIIALPYLLFRFRGSQSGAEGVAQAITADPTVLLLSVIGVIPAHLLTAGAAWVVVTQRGRRPFWRTLGWSFSKRFGLWQSVSVAIVLYLAGAVLSKLIGGGQTDIDVLVNSTLPVRLLLALVATFSGPLVEEIVFRGVLYSSLQKRIGMAGAVALVSFLFALVHVYQYRNSLGVITVILMLSVSLTLVRAFTGRLLPCVIIHMVFNGITSVLIVFQPYLKFLDGTVDPKVTGLMTVWRTLILFS